MIACLGGLDARSEKPLGLLVDIDLFPLRISNGRTGSDGWLGLRVGIIVRFGQIDEKDRLAPVALKFAADRFALNLKRFPALGTVDLMH